VIRIRVASKCSVNRSRGYASPDETVANEPSSTTKNDSPFVPRQQYSVRIEWGSPGAEPKHTDGQVHGGPHTQGKIALDASIVEPNSTGHANPIACSLRQSLLNENAASGTLAGAAERVTSRSH
jgi:hypothetical protein